MIAYKSIVYDRWYGGSQFSGSVVNLSGFEDIDYGRDTVDDIVDFYNDNLLAQDEEEYTREGLRAKFIENEIDTFDKVSEYVEDVLEPGGFEVDDYTASEFYNYINTGVEPVVGKLKNYLLAAYDPGSSFSLGEAKVEEREINTRYEKSLVFEVTNISTWYGNISYDESTKKTEYYIDAVQSNSGVYNEFDYDDLTEYTDGANEDKTKIYIYSGRAAEVGITAGENVTELDGADIYDNVLSEKIRK